MYHWVATLGIMCSCNSTFWPSCYKSHRDLPKNYCTRIKNLEAVPCNGDVIGIRNVSFSIGGCLKGQTEDGRTWLYVSAGGRPSFAQVESVVEGGRVCLAPDAKDFAIYDEEDSGIVYLELALFVRCDSSYCASPEGIPNWHYEPDLMEEYENSD